MDGLKETIFKFLRLDGLIDNLSGYVEARIELVKIEIREEVAKVIAKAMILAVVFFFALMFIFFFSVALAHFLNRFFSESYIGYSIVAGIYLACFLVFIIFKKDILKNFEHRLVEAIKHREK